MFERCYLVFGRKGTLRKQEEGGGGLGDEDTTFN